MITRETIGPCVSIVVLGIVSWCAGCGVSRSCSHPAAKPTRIGGIAGSEIGEHATVCGGHGNSASGDGAVVSGGSRNAASAYHAAVGGGSYNAASVGHSVVGGGLENSAGGSMATVGGGWANTATHVDATVGGGRGNAEAGRNATVCGGLVNKAQRGAAVAGGSFNTASANAAIGGGSENKAGGFHATISGGAGNKARANYATVAGGLSNQATAIYATSNGGWGNTAGGDDSTIAGGFYNSAAGDFSYACGRRARVDETHSGAFLYADGNDAVFHSAAANEFAVRATGGARLVTAIDGRGTPSAGVRLARGSGSWSIDSDREGKVSVLPVDESEILALLSELPIWAWNYRGQPPWIRHIGSMAQDFHALFGLGEDDRHISAVDADGVALAAIQRLYQLAVEKEAEVAALEARVAALEKTCGVDDSNSSPPD